MLLEFDGEAVGPVQVAEEQDGDVAAHCVFHLDHLILLGGSVGAVGDQEILGDLLFDGYPGRGVLFGSCSCQERIDSEIADAEQMFDSSAQLTRNRLGQ